MKSLKLVAVIVCASALWSGCASKQACCASTAVKSSCGMQCCTDAKATCATCPKCNAKK